MHGYRVKASALESISSRGRASEAVISGTLLSSRRTPPYLPILATISLPSARRVPPASSPAKKAGKHLCNCVGRVPPSPLTGRAVLSRSRPPPPRIPASTCRRTARPPRRRRRTRRRHQPPRTSTAGSWPPRIGDRVVLLDPVMQIREPTAGARTWSRPRTPAPCSSTPPPVAWRHGRPRRRTHERGAGLREQRRQG